MHAEHHLVHGTCIVPIHSLDLKNTNLFSLYLTPRNHKSLFCSIPSAGICRTLMSSRPYSEWSCLNCTVTSLWKKKKSYLIY